MIPLESGTLKILNKMELTQVWAHSWTFLIIIDTVVIFSAHDKNGTVIKTI